MIMATLPPTNNSKESGGSEAISFFDFGKKLMGG